MLSITNHKLYIVFFALIVTLFASKSVYAQKDQLPIVDPFARNVQRPAQYGAVPAPKAREERKLANTVADLKYQYDEDIARLPDLRNYRVVSISTKSTLNKPLILGPDLTTVAVGTSARKTYLRIATFANLSQAKQFIWDFYEDKKKFIDTNFLIRREKDKNQIIYRVDIGPFVNERHASLFCANIVSDKNNTSTECVTSKELQSVGERSSFKSTATVGLASSMVEQMLASNKKLDSVRLYAASYEIAEGETLGKNDFVVIKITQRGVYLANESGHLFLLPTDIIPLPPSADEPDE
jgi:hypothetical protein